MCVKYGFLDYQYSTNRMDIVFEDGSRFDGLHCGQPLEAKINGKWTPTRIEYGRDWYIVGAPKVMLEGLKVRI